MPLHFSAKEGKEETMRLILDSKIDVDQRGNRKKRTALMLASVHGHTHIQETLLDEYHADVNLSSSSQMTAAHYAAVKGGSEALKVLLKHNANINARHIDGRTPLYFAAQLKNARALKLLLKSKADIHEADMDQVTPIHAASMHGDVAIIEYLLKAKGDVERKDCDGFTALHDAAVSDNLEACRLIRRYLLSSVHQDTIVEEAADQARDHGHDVIATWLESSLGFTPLHFACDARDVEWVRRILLTDSYLDIEKLSHDGLTPLDVARKSGTDDGWLEPEPRIIEMVTAAASCWKPKFHSVFPKSFRSATVLILMIRNRGQHGYYSVWNPILRMLGRNHFLQRPGRSQLDRKRKVGSVLQLEKDMSRVMTPEGRTSRRSGAEEPPQKRSPSP